MRNTKPRRRIWLALVVIAALATVAKLAWGGDVLAPTYPNWWAWLDPSLTLATFGAATAVWWEERRDRRVREQPIVIVVACASLGASAELPIRPLRQHLNRAELLGILGMYAGASRIETADLLPTFTPGANGLSPLNLVVNGAAAQLTIQLPETTFKQLQARIPSQAGPAPESPNPT